MLDAPRVKVNKLWFFPWGYYLRSTPRKLYSQAYIHTQKVLVLSFVFEYGFHTQNPQILGMKPKPKPKFFFSFFELFNFFFSNKLFWDENLMKTIFVYFSFLNKYFFKLFNFINHSIL